MKTNKTSQKTRGASAFRPDHISTRTGTDPRAKYGSQFAADLQPA
jgi:hypothetical protein